MKHKGYIKERIIFSLFGLSTALGLSILVLVLILLWSSSHNILSWHFLVSNWQHRDILQAGIFPAIVGSVLLGLGVTLVTFPFGVATAIYLTEYNKVGFWRRFIQLAIRNLAGVPSVVYGLFGLAAFVHFLKFGTSLLSAILTLSVMTLPWIITASVEALESIPQKFRDSSLALGASQWQTIWKVVLPAAIPGSITGGIIGIARAMGETAPIILVGATFFLSNLPKSLLDKFMVLPYHTFILATQHSSPYAPSFAAGTALVLIGLTFFMSLAAIFLRYKFRKNKNW
jgi:phosphate transport system permease protein